jgi:hypothetical protein
MSEMSLRPAYDPVNVSHKDTKDTKERTKKERSRLKPSSGLKRDC